MLSTLLQIPWDGMNRLSIVYRVVDEGEHVPFTNEPDGEGRFSAAPFYFALPFHF